MKNISASPNESLLTASELIPGVVSQWVQLGDVRLHVVTAGPEDGPPLLFLHGFPEFWFGWRHQVAYFANRGFRVILPDQRGYNLSDKPKGIDAYQVKYLTMDMVNLLDHFGYAQATVIGHDWGALVAWWTAIRFPHRISRLVIINVPHPYIASRHLRSDFRQMIRSLYILFFQLPWLPEKLFSARGYAAMVRAISGSSLPGTFSQIEFENYISAWSKPGALTAMLNWYRALRYSVTQSSHAKRVHVPTLLLWGVHDTALGSNMAAPSAAMCDDSQLVFFENATHWVHHEEVGQVNSLIENFVNSQGKK